MIEITVVLLVVFACFRTQFVMRNVRLNYMIKKNGRREENVKHFLDLIKRSRRGKFKIYIGMIAGVGKSYRMLQEAHEMLENGVDVQIGYIETHGRTGTVAMLEGLPLFLGKRYFIKERKWKRWI